MLSYSGRSENDFGSILSGTEPPSILSEAQRSRRTGGGVQSKDAALPAGCSAPFDCALRCSAQGAPLHLGAMARHLARATAWSWLLALLLAIAAAAAGCSHPSAASSTVKLVVEADGIYEVAATALARAGFDLATARADELALTSGGAPVAFQLIGQGRNRALRFYGQALPSEAYTGRNVYWLSRPTATAAAAAATLIAERSAPPAASGAPVNAVADTLRIEERRHYRSQAQAGESRWYWESLFAPAESAITLSAPQLLAGEAILRIGVYGKTFSPDVDPDHHLRLVLNGAQVADVTWDGLGPHSIEAALPDGILHTGENRLVLTAPGDTGAPIDSLDLEWVEITYPRELVANGPGLAFNGAASGYAVRVSSRPAAVWDVTDPAAPVALTETAWQDGILRFGSDGASRRFIVAPDAALRQPPAVTAAENADLRNWPGGADLIIITAPAFRAALQPLVAAREAQGLRVAVMDVEQVYDAFGDGRAGPEPIKALVQWARAHWTAPAPRYLLLAGDASYDPRGYLGGAELDLIPTQSVYTTFSGWTGSDVWYAMPDDGPAAKPILAVGRFPAQNAEQLADMVAKTLAYEEAEGTETWRDKAFLVADNDEPGFVQQAAEFAKLLAGYTSEQVTITDDGSAARAALLRAFAEGRGLVGYFGHGSITLWAREKVFDVEDAGKLSNRDRLPIVFTVTCLSGLFEHPTTPSLGETLLRTKKGGAVAALVPSSAAVLSDQQLLAHELALALSTPADGTGPRTLGAAVRQAQAGLPDSLGGIREILLTFNLLGDPALRLSN